MPLQRSVSSGPPGANCKACDGAPGAAPSCQIAAVPPATGRLRRFLSASIVRRLGGRLDQRGSVSMRPLRSLLEETMPMSVDEPDAFFVVGGTVPVESASYVKRQADEEIYAGLRRGEFCY